MNLDTAIKILGHNSETTREKDDFYATPKSSVVALLDVEKFDNPILEPCCGQGHISKVLMKYGYTVHSTDLVDRGFGQSRIDALMEFGKVKTIITNPPYKNALEFAEHFTYQAEKVALLLKLNFLEGKARKEFFMRKPPTKVYVFSQRQSLMKNGQEYNSGGMMALAWFIWEKNNKTPPNIFWI